MNTSSNRVKGALISVAALAAFGMIIPANADGMSSGKDAGSVGNANPGGPPPGIDNHDNNGWRCNDGNNGAGVGNPAQGQCGGTGSNTDPGTGPGQGNGNGPGTGGGAGHGGGSGSYSG